MRQKDVHVESVALGELPVSGRLLDADPLADNANTTTIRAVMANGRCFDRVAFDRLLVQTSRGLAGSHTIAEPYD